MNDAFAGRCVDGQSSADMIQAVSVNLAMKLEFTDR